MNFSRILRLVKKELLQTSRDRRMLMIIFVAPVFELFIFGYAVTTDINHISTAVFDESRTAESRQLIDQMIRSRYFDYKYYIERPGKIDALLDAGKVQLVLHIPRRFALDLHRNRTAVVQTILDGSDAMTARTIGGYVTSVMQEYSAGIAVERLQREKSMVSSLPGIDARPRVWYNPELKSIYYMVPGVLCLILLLITMILTALAVVREKEIGTLEQLIVTPVTAGELILGKTLPFLLIGLLDMTLVLLVAVFWFHVYVAGSVLLLFALSLLFLLTSLGLGLFVSTISNTQHEATLTIFLLFMPMIVMSGFIFPVENMPVSIQWIAYLIPLKYFLEIIRGIFLKGLGFHQVWPQVLIIMLFGIVTLTVSALRFQKRLG